jgi:hypothetical protein
MGATQKVLAGAAAGEQLDAKQIIEAVFGREAQDWKHKR